MHPVVVVALTVLAALVVGWAVRRWVVFLVTVESESMMPTLAPGQKLLARRLARSRPLRRDDIVVVDSAELGQVIVKRVAGLAGDRFRLDGTVCGPVPPDHLILVGDNRNRSSDSRAWQQPYIPVDRVLGRVVGVKTTPTS